MGSSDKSRCAPLPAPGEPLRAAFVGSAVWLEGCAPPAGTHALAPLCIEAGPGEERALESLAAFRPHVAVVFDPPALSPELLESLTGATLGVLVGAPPESASRALAALDRVVSFAPSLSGTRAAGSEVWRAIPPPVSDRLFAEVRPLHRAPRAMSIGRSTEHREAMLMPAKHHHDLLQVIHGVTGAPLAEMLAQHDVGVYVAPEPRGSFGLQVGIHLAAGQLLVCQPLPYSHGLERGIDYLQIDSPDGLVWVLERLSRFPEMHHSVRVRGRLKAEQFRASRVFARLAHDLLADVGAFAGAARA